MEEKYTKEIFILFSHKLKKITMPWLKMIKRVKKKTKVHKTKTKNDKN